MMLSDSYDRLCTLHMDELDCPSPPVVINELIFSGQKWTIHGGNIGKLWNIISVGCSFPFRIAICGRLIASVNKICSELSHKEVYLNIAIVIRKGISNMLDACNIVHQGPLLKFVLAHFVCNLPTICKITEVLSKVIMTI